MVLDAQATAADPARGALLEIGWTRWSAVEARTLPAADVTAHVVAAPPGVAVPPAVARITGLRTAEWARGLAPVLVWQGLRRAAERVAPLPVPTVVHFARFEEPFRERCTSATGTRGSPSISSAPTRSPAGCSRSCPAARCERSPATSGPRCPRCAAAPTTWPPPPSCGATWSRCSPSAKVSSTSASSERGWHGRPDAPRAAGPSRASAASSCRTARVSIGCCAPAGPCCTSARPPPCASA